VDGNGKKGNISENKGGGEATRRTRDLREDKWCLGALGSAGRFCKMPALI